MENGMTVHDPRTDYHLVWAHPHTGQQFLLGSETVDYSTIRADLGLIVCMSTACNVTSRYVPLLHAPIYDSPYVQSPLGPLLRRLIPAIHALDDGRDIYMHCAAGRNRSALVMALYLWSYHRRHFTSMADIVTTLRIRRPMALLTNRAFLQLLADVEVVGVGT